MILAILNFYVAPMPPIKFEVNPHKGLGGADSFEEFQDGHYGSHLGCKNGTNLTVLNLLMMMSPQRLPPSFSLIRITVWLQMSFHDWPS